MPLPCPRHTKRVVGSPWKRDERPLLPTPVAPAEPVDLFLRLAGFLTLITKGLVPVPGHAAKEAAQLLDEIGEMVRAIERAAPAPSAPASSAPAAKAPTLTQVQAVDRIKESLTALEALQASAARKDSDR